MPLSLELMKLMLEVMLMIVLLTFLLQFYSKYIWQQRNKKKEYTFDFCREDQRNYELIFSFKDKMNKHDLYINEIKNKEFNFLFESQQAEALQFFEKIAIGINNNLLDEKIIYDYYYRYFAIAYSSLKYALMNYTNNSEDQKLYIEYLKLINKWLSKEGKNVKY